MRGFLALSQVPAGHSELLKAKADWKTITKTDSVWHFFIYLFIFLSNIFYCFNFSCRLLQVLTGSRALFHVPVSDAVAEQHLVQVVDDFWRTDLQILLDLRQGHLQCRPAALVVLLLQFLNSPICQLAEGANQVICMYFLAFRYLI